MAQKYKSNSNPAQLDQFYTNTKIAKTIISDVLKKIPIEKRRIFLEPSAGNGVYLNMLSIKIGDQYRDRLGG